MAQDNVELVRAIYADWERGDFTSIEWGHPEIEMVVADGPSPGRSVGMTAIKGAWRDVLSVWKDFRVEVERYRQLDDGRVLVLIRNTGRGKASGVELAEVGTRGANVWTIVGDKATRLVAYWDRDRAYADLGISE
jgi:ketosteroid isomerase-like protein